LVIRRILLATVTIALVAAANAGAAPVGETHRATFERTAALRDAKHRPDLRITVWYPAEAGAVERSLVIGPPDAPSFDVGAVAPDAAFADTTPRPVILLSHGFGGSARMMGWFGIALARSGYIVVAVDHPGNNGADKMTPAGALLYWDRPDDLRAALAATEHDPVIGPHMDFGRVGVAGFSAGGFTALAAAGARVDLGRFDRFCQANPNDGLCRPQIEFVITAQDRDQFFQLPQAAAEAAHAGDDHAVPGVRAAFTMAPALVQSFDPASLAHMHTPVYIILGDADPVATPATNGMVAATLIPGAELEQLPGVGHYDFLATCTAQGAATRAVCKSAVPQSQTHRQAITAAKAFFARTLSPGEAP
jgi:predicted dienelactone hydrolase